MKEKMGQTNIGTPKTIPGNKVGLTKALMIAAVSLMSVLRVIALESDAYSHLSYSSALLTDEGFYIHNARNVALFGHPRTDQFNNMLIMPTLHQVQVWVFAAWGVGAVQARAISVGAGLLTLLVFYLAVRRSFGTQLACIGLLFLGLGHANILYNRMALMDTPAALGLMCVFATWVYGVHRTYAGGRGSQALFCLSGFMIAVTYATRGLSAWIIPVPFALLTYRAWSDQKSRKTWQVAALSQAAGLGFGTESTCWHGTCLIVLSLAI
jgi:4-amino-4-deoxy-L-arabinose transferase-like glycosyltransferase